MAEKEKQQDLQETQHNQAAQGHAHNADVQALIATLDQADISSSRMTVTRILEVINRPDSGAFDLKAVIETDPPLTMRLLRRANSAYYGVNREMTEIMEAIICIGFDAVRDLALNQSVCEFFKTDCELHGYSAAALWLHSVATAICGKMICRREFQLPGEQVYAAGLLHDIGIVVEHQCRRTDFLQVLQAFSKNPAKGLYEHERRLLGFSHAEVGRALAQHWNFPAALSEMIGAEQPDPPASGDGREMAVQLPVLFLAKWAVQNRGLGFVETPAVGRRRMLEISNRLNVTERGLDFIMDEVEQEIGKMQDDGWF